MTYTVFTSQVEGSENTLELHTSNGIWIYLNPDSHPGDTIHLSDEDARELVNKINEYLLASK